MTRKRMRYVAAIGVASAALLVGAGSASAQTDPGTQVWEAGGSNMGECSAYLGGMQVRDDVNQLIRQYGAVLQVSDPGQIFRVRAQQAVNLPPAQECVQHTF